MKAAAFSELWWACSSLSFGVCESYRTLKKHGFSWRSRRWRGSCARSYKEEGGKENPFCQSFLQDIERDCAKFKPSWSDWWTNDLKKDHCYAIERTYDFGLKEATKEIRDKCNYLSSVETRNLVSKVIYQLDCIKKELISIKDEVKAIKQMLDDSDKRGKEMKKN
ncbi:uncharacterized protein LOC111318286 isoform X2 [Durio zibethinus]|uniref:Uncharacterized protein LOC111318286 isoform X2 n=1 Tax=Durio zibethinus TaxID=66656 RepID=A0A6P6BI53_DURZI|nr:uncharacterized protein LOC111318286 isoform X2 [Durio zibethinus]